MSYEDFKKINDVIKEKIKEYKNSIDKKRCEAFNFKTNKLKICQ
ncbi:hypothetical protein [Fusobacterium nucleatum]|nr:hypothetical protein [Fusobacterium nucleatum]